MNKMPVAYLSDEDYKFCYSRVSRFCIDLLVTNSAGEVLLSERNIEPHKGAWQFTGGFQRFRETIYDAQKRLLEKETGIRSDEFKCDEFVLLGHAEFLEEEFSDQTPMHSISNVYQVYFDGIIPGLGGDAESKGLQFFAPEDVLGIGKLNPGVRDFFERVKNGKISL